MATLNARQDCVPHENWERLLEHVGKIWDAISSSAQKCPPECRRILSHVRTQVEDKYGQFFPGTIYTATSSLLFLRFFCPAILSPRIYGLTSTQPSAVAQRSLVLVVKSLQGLANMSKFGVKEPWMGRMNFFIEAKVRDLKAFLIIVSTFPASAIKAHLHASQYCAQKVIRSLPSAVRESIPSVPYLIDEPRECAVIVNLWMKSYRQYTSRKDVKLDTSLQKFHNACQAIEQEVNHRIRQLGRTCNSEGLIWDPQYLDRSPRQSRGKVVPHRDSTGGIDESTTKKTSFSGIFSSKRRSGK